MMVKGLLIERVIRLKSKYKVLLIILGTLIFLIAMLLFGNLIYKSEYKKYCSKLPLHQFYQNNYCLKLYDLEEDTYE